MGDRASGSSFSHLQASTSTPGAVSYSSIEDEYHQRLLLMDDEEDQDEDLFLPPSNVRNGTADGGGGASGLHHQPHELKTGWRRVPSYFGTPPSPRSGAASVVHGDKLYIFGGYGGESRLSDFFSYCFKLRAWAKIENGNLFPRARENNGFVAYKDCLYLFGGYDGMHWLSDLWEFNTVTNRWRLVEPRQDRSECPSKRFGFVSVTFEDSLYLFGGYNGRDWLQDMYRFNFLTETWAKLDGTTCGDLPSKRSCPSWALIKNSIFMFGGYDGVERKSDLYEYRILESRWIRITANNGPSGRYFHACGVHGDCFTIFGGYNGTERLSDLHRFSSRKKKWTTMTKLTQSQSSSSGSTSSGSNAGGPSGGDIPSGRSSLVAQVHGNSLYVFGGYNGNMVLNDFYEYTFENIYVEPPHLRNDLARLINHPQFSDVTFLVEGKQVHAVRGLLAIRSEHFRALLFGGMKESQGVLQRDPIPLPDIQYDVFLAVLEYLYTDRIGYVGPDLAVRLLIAAERYLLPRLKSLCEQVILKSISFENAIQILLEAYMFNAQSLKEICLEFIVTNIVAIKTRPQFQFLKQEPDLLMEIVMRTNNNSNNGSTSTGAAGMGSVSNSSATKKL